MNTDTHACKTCVVTGASSGIGKAIAQEIATQGHRVIMLCRDRERAERARNEILQHTNSALTELVIADLGTLSACHEAAQKIAQSSNHLDVLIHNAGMWPTKLEMNSDGFEMSFAVNALAPFMLNALLFERLAPAAARIVQVSAGLHVAGRIDIERTPSGQDFHRLKSYADTKLWNLICTIETARRLKPKGVCVNAVHPGVVRTGLGDMTGVLGFVLRVVKSIWSSPAQGAKGPVHLALAHELEGVSARYYDKLKLSSAAPLVYDEKLAQSLWQRSVELTGLNDIFGDRV